LYYNFAFPVIKKKIFKKNLLASGFSKEKDGEVGFPPSGASINLNFLPHEVLECLLP